MLKSKSVKVKYHSRNSDLHAKDKHISMLYRAINNRASYSLGL